MALFERDPKFKGCSHDLTRMGPGRAHTKGLTDLLCATEQLISIPDPVELDAENTEEDLGAAQALEEKRQAAMETLTETYNGICRDLTRRFGKTYFR